MHELLEYISESGIITYSFIIYQILSEKEPPRIIRVDLPSSEDVVLISSAAGDLWGNCSFDWKSLSTERPTHVRQGYLQDLDTVNNDAAEVDDVTRDGAFHQLKGGSSVILDVLDQMGMPTEWVVKTLASPDAGFTHDQFLQLMAGLEDLDETKRNEALSHNLGLMCRQLRDGNPNEKMRLNPAGHLVSEAIVWQRLLADEPVSSMLPVFGGLSFFKHNGKFIPYIVEQKLGGTDLMDAAIDIYLHENNKLARLGELLVSWGSAASKMQDKLIHGDIKTSHFIVSDENPKPPTAGHLESKYLIKLIDLGLSGIKREKSPDRIETSADNYAPWTSNTATLSVMSYERINNTLTSSADDVYAMTKSLIYILWGDTKHTDYFTYMGHKGSVMAVGLNESFMEGIVGRWGISAEYAPAIRDLLEKGMAPEVSSIEGPGKGHQLRSNMLSLAPILIGELLLALSRKESDTGSDPIQARFILSLMRYASGKYPGMERPSHHSLMEEVFLRLDDNNGGSHVQLVADFVELYEQGNGEIEELLYRLANNLKPVYSPVRDGLEIVPENVDKVAGDFLVWLIGEFRLNGKIPYYPLEEIGALGGSMPDAPSYEDYIETGSATDPIDTSYDWSTDSFL